jgi:hypothetical protein
LQKVSATLAAGALAIELVLSVKSFTEKCDWCHELAASFREVLSKIRESIQLVRNLATMKRWTARLALPLRQQEQQNARLVVQLFGSGIWTGFV